MRSNFGALGFCVWEAGPRFPGSVSVEEELDAGEVDHIGSGRRWLQGGERRAQEASRRRQGAAPAWGRCWHAALCLISKFYPWD